jgi:hypothetical protein
MAQSISAVYPLDNEEVDYSLFSFNRPQPGLAFELDAEYQAHLKNLPIQHACTRRLQEQLAPDTACHKILAVLSYMDSLSLDLPLFLDLLSWGDKACTENMKINYERTALMVSKELPSILKRWHQPPHSPGSTATRPAGASGTLEHFSFDCVTEVVDQELGEFGGEFIVVQRWRGSVLKQMVSFHPPVEEKGSRDDTELMFICLCKEYK